MKRSIETIHKIINNLTADEDYRQDLWVLYLENNSLVAFNDLLERLQLHKKRLDEDIEFIQGVFSDNSKLQSFLTHFSDFEKEIMFLMAIGFTSTAISRYKNISEVRILQAICAIRSKSIWNVLRKE